MKSKKNKGKLALKIILFSLIFFFPILQSQAEEKTDQVENSSKEEPQANQLTGVNCFDYYQFQSVNLEILPSINTAVPGTTFEGKILAKNKNQYPVVDGSIFLKIYKKQKEEEKKLINGDFLIDQFFVAENVSMDQDQEKSFDFKWDVPSALEPGEYYFTAYFQSSKKFNLAGLSFTDDIKGGIAVFDVIDDGSFSGTVEFDKNNVKLNGEPFNFIGKVKTFSSNEEVLIEAPIENTTAKTIDLKIETDVYYWDSLSDSNKIFNSEKKEIKIAPGKKEMVWFKVKPNKFAVNYVLITAKYLDKKTILPVRFGKNDIESARINFPGITNFPLKKGEKVEIFSCAHAVKDKNYMVSFFNLEDEAEDQVQNERNYSLQLTLKDKKTNEIVGEFKYEGIISADMNGYKADFIPDRNLDNVSLEAVLKDEKGEIVDHSEMDFNCSEINSNKCFSPVSSFGEKAKNGMNYGKNWIFLIAIILGLLFLVIFILKKMKKEHHLFFLFFIFLAGFFWVGGKAEAKSVTPNASLKYGKDNTYFGYKTPFQFNNNIYWNQLHIPDSPTALYSTTSSLGEIDLQVLMPGETFAIKKSQEATWNIYGSLFDTPFAYWKENSELTSDIKKSQADFVAKFQKDCFSPGHWEAVQQSFPDAPQDWSLTCKATVDLYTPVVFSPPKTNLIVSGPVSCTESSPDIWQCAVSQNARGGDKISIKLSFEKTFGKAYAISDAYLDYGNGVPDYEIHMDYKSKVYGKLNCSSGDNKEFGARTPGGHHASIMDPKNINSCSNIKQYFCEFYSFGSYFDSCYSGESVCSGCEDETDIFQIDPAEIGYEYTISPDAKNNPPQDPIIFGPTEGHITKENSFSIVSTDPENDTLKYGLDWDMDKTVDQWIPSSGFVNSGTSQIFFKIYSSEGTFTFQAIAQDSRGASSGWVSHSIKIVSAICDLPWGETIQEGESVVAYSQGVVSCESSCQSQERVCQTDGSLSGTYKQKDCAVMSCSCFEYPNGICDLSENSPNLCQSGSVKDFGILSTGWSWKCYSEANPTKTANCSAEKKCDGNWVETHPGDISE